MEVTKPKPRRKAPLPVLPSAIDDEVRKVAEEIVKERRAEARKVAAIELANQLLKTACALLKHASDGTPVSTVAAAPPRVVNPCVICGAPGVWQDKKHGGGWHCPIHAQAERMDQRVEAAGSGLFESLRNAQPIEDASLPE